VKRPDGLTAGVLYTLGAFLLWGLIPPYWKLIANVPALQIPAHRIVWTCLFLALFITVRGRWGAVRTALGKPKTALTLLLTAVLVTVNWTLFIVEVSMGYFINPLVSVFLGVVILRERLTFWQGISVALALGGVIFQAAAYRVVPWLPLGLAFTFGLYGLFRKTVAVDSTTGTFLETLFLLPLTLAFLGWEMAGGVSAFGTANLQTHVFLVLAGVVTAVPLVWFANGARLLPLSMVGFLQYLTPTLHLLIGVVLYREAFTIVNLGGFGLIWLGIAVYALSTALAGGGRAAAPAPR
jgi:chloramphenicol-sensitive protein RarD